MATKTAAAAASGWTTSFLHCETPWVPVRFPRHPCLPPDALVRPTLQSLLLGQSHHSPCLAGTSLFRLHNKTASSPRTIHGAPLSAPASLRNARRRANHHARRQPFVASFAVPHLVKAPVFCLVCPCHVCHQSTQHGLLVALGDARIHQPTIVEGHTQNRWRGGDNSASFVESDTRGLCQTGWYIRLAHYCCWPSDSSPALRCGVPPYFSWKSCTAVEVHKF